MGALLGLMSSATHSQPKSVGALHDSHAAVSSSHLSKALVFRDSIRSESKIFPSRVAQFCNASSDILHWPSVTFLAGRRVLALGWRRSGYRSKNLLTVIGEPFLVHHIDKPLELYKTTEKDSLGFDSCRNLLGDEISAHTVILHINGRPCPLLKSVIIHCKTKSARAKLAIIKNLLPNLLFISSLISFIQVSWRFRRSFARLASRLSARLAHCICVRSFRKLWAGCDCMSYVWPMTGIRCCLTIWLQAQTNQHWRKTTTELTF